MLNKLINYLASQPAIFSFLRKIIELNFAKQKRIIKQFLASAKGGKILDIGCGTGEFASLFKNFDYYGIDISPEYISYARRKKQGHFLVMDAANLKFAEKSFDYILIMAILHHLDDHSVLKLLKEAHRVLKPGGKILIMEDAKIKALENPLIRFMQNLDKGTHIRNPQQYQVLVAQFFNIQKQLSFRSGLCIYHSFILENNYV